MPNDMLNNADGQCGGYAGGEGRTLRGRGGSTQRQTGNFGKSESLHRAYENVRFEKLIADTDLRHCRRNCALALSIRKRAIAD